MKFNVLGASEFLGVSVPIINKLLKHEYLTDCGTRACMIALKELREFQQMCDLEGHQQGRYVSKGEAMRLLRLTGVGLNSLLQKGVLEAIYFPWSPLDEEYGVVITTESVMAEKRRKKNA